jgi:hypothetical protein
MKIRVITSLALAGLLLSSPALAWDKPNVVLMLADNLGFSTSLHFHENPDGRLFS